MPLERGAVWLTRTLVTQQGGIPGLADKFVVVLQDPEQMDVGATSIAVLIASTDRTGGREPRAFEVRLGVEDGFDHSTIVDGRWVYTLLRAHLDEFDYRFTLSDDRMDDIGVAVFVGLQLAM
jgi:hypothetical protein